METIFSVIKRTMGDEIRSVKTVAQNNEMRTKIICYNATRIVDMASSLLRGFLQSLKGIIFLRPVRVWLRSHVEAHVRICYMAYAILSLLEYKVSGMGISGLKHLNIKRVQGHAE